MARVAVREFTDLISAQGIEVEKRILPGIVILLVVLLVSVLAAWTLQVAQRKPEQIVPETSASIDAPLYEWKLVTTWPKGLPGLYSAPEKFAERVFAMSDGRLRIRVYGAGELVPPFEVFTAVSQGAAQMGHGAAYYWKGKMPAAVFFTAIPFAMNAQEMNGWLHHGGGMALWEKLYAPYGVIPFAGGSTGVQMAGWFNRELRDRGDLDGLKMRIPGLAGEVFSGAGGTAVTIAGSEIYTSMQTGVIDAVEWVGPYNDRILGLQEVGQYYYYPGWHEPGAMLEFTVNQAAFESLPSDLQAIIKNATEAVSQDTLDEFTAANNESLRRIRASGRNDIRQLPDDVLQALYDSSEVAIANLMATDAAAREIGESYFQFFDDVRAYHEISERAYLNARDRVLPPIAE